MTNQELSAQLDELCALPHETECVEWKCNNAEPEQIGEYLSALSNAALLHDSESAFLVWGIENETHAVAGTNFRPRTAKIGNENLENWLLRLCAPRLEFFIEEWEHNGKRIVMFRIQPCRHTPVRWKNTAFIRIGSVKKKLSEFPEIERALWLKTRGASFESDIALARVSADDVLQKLDYPTYFDLLGQPLPASRNAIIERLIAERLIRSVGASRYDITNLGALLFAKRLSDFPALARKAVRVIVYRGKNRIQTIKEIPVALSDRGYAVGFEALLAYTNDQLPTNEQIGQALRREERMYPQIAVRELVANAIIHQDLNFTGDSPMVEIFDDRIEITNAGQPLIDPLRFIDEPPQSRNEAMASLMRRINICEERGTGIDKTIFYIELFQLPAPDFIETQNHTKAMLFAYKKLTSMDSKERIRACYQHACLQWVSNEQMTNTSLRKRFSIADKNYAIASRIIAETMRQELIKVADPENTSKKHIRYVPFWA